jgi:hypothetical protein
MDGLFYPDIAFYKDPIQTGFLMTFRKSYSRTGIVNRSGKNRNLEDSYSKKGGNAPQATDLQRDLNPPQAAHYL